MEKEKKKRNGDGGSRGGICTKEITSSEMKTKVSEKRAKTSSFY